MKPFHRLTDSEKYKLEKIGLLWELYPEGSLYKPMPDSEKKLTALGAFGVIVENFNPYARKETSREILGLPIEEPDNPEMVTFLEEVEKPCYDTAQFERDIQSIAVAWEGQMNYKTLCKLVEQNGGCLMVK